MPMAASPPANCAEKRHASGDRDRAVTGASNFNTWDLAASFKQADPRYQLAVVVAQYADVLRHSPWAAGTSASQLVEHAYRLSALLWDDAEVVEFANLVSRANQIRALGIGTAT